MISDPAAIRQPDPTRDEKASEAVLPHILAAFPSASKVRDDLKARAQFGDAKYGIPVMTHNGRDALVDAYQEILDAIQYLKQAQLEMRERQGVRAAVLESRIEHQFNSVVFIAKQLQMILDDRT